MRASPALPPLSERRLAVFAWYARRLVARRFTALRVSMDAPPRPLEGPTVFFANHASWWDPLVMLLVARWAYPQIAFYAPIDSAALARYPSLGKIGFFGVEPSTPAGARRFLTVARAVLAQPNAALAMTPQGRFADVRERPIRLQGGLARLLLHVPACEARAVAIEYPFWNEARPEALVGFGSAAIAAEGRPHAAVNRCLSTELALALDALADRAGRRDPAEFVTVMEGRRGIGFVQDLPARLRAWRRGSHFEPRHAAVRGAGVAGPQRNE